MGNAAACKTIPPEIGQLIQRLQDALPAGIVAPGSDVELLVGGETALLFLSDGKPVEAVPRPSEGRGNDRVEARIELEGLPAVSLSIARQGLDSTAGQLVWALLQAVLARVEAERNEEKLLEELSANWESLEALYEISTDIRRSSDIKEALKRLIDRLVSIQESLHAMVYVLAGAWLEPLTGTVAEASPLDVALLGEIEPVMRDCHVVLANGLQDKGGARGGRYWQRATSLAAAPITSRQSSIGFVIVWREDDRYTFDSAVSRMLEAIAYQMSILIESDRLNRKLRESELLAQEVQIASSIQEVLLLGSTPQDVPSIEIAAFSAPSQQIDGDFYDFFQHPDGSIDVLVGDVMGKGVAAALLGAATKNQLLRGLADLALGERTGAPDPAEIVNWVSSRMGERLIALERFVTLCYARFDLKQRLMTFVDCGHTGAIRRRRQEPGCAFIRGRDLPLGVLQSFQCESHSLPILPGDTYVFYSDGITENRTPDGELFGEDRLAECVENWSALGPALLIEQIRKEAMVFNGSQQFSDDFTCVVIRLRLGSQTEPPAARRERVFPCDVDELPALRTWLDEVANLAPEGERDEECMARMELACTELFANCAVHGGEESFANPICIEALVFPGRTSIRIRHKGASFNPLAVPKPAFDGSRSSGFGSYIVVRLADELAYERETDGTNVTTISFARGGRE